MKLSGDVDMDVPDRDKILAKIRHVPAHLVMSTDNYTTVKKHPSGVYPVDIPYDPILDYSTLDYVEAEQRGYFKLDLLNVSIYEYVKDEEHLYKLMNDEPMWEMLEDRIIVGELSHVNNSYDYIRQLPWSINSIERLAVFLALIRPSKKHLIYLPFNELEKIIWEKDPNGFVFRKSHAIAYATMVVVHMNLLRDGPLEAFHQHY